MMAAIVVLWMNLKQLYLKRFRCLIYCFLNIDLFVLMIDFFSFKRQKNKNYTWKYQILSFKSYMSQFFTLNL